MVMMLGLPKKEMDVERLQSIYEDIGRPGATALRNAARRQGISITTREAQDFVRGQSERQVFAPRIPSDGRVTAAREDSRWQVDLIDFSKERMLMVPLQEQLSK